MDLKELAAKISVDTESLNKKIEAIASKQKEIEVEEKSYLEKIAGQTVITSKTRSNSYEKKLLSSFRAKSFQELISVNTGHAAFRNIGASEKQAVAHLKEVCDISRYIAQIYYGGRKDAGNFLDGRVARVEEMLESNYAKEHLVPLIKAFDSSVSGTGGAWVPTIISSSFQAEYELDFTLAARQQTMPMPSNPFQLPVQSGVTTARIIGEGATITDSNFATSVIEWDAKKTGEYYIIPAELDEDSAPAILSIARSEVTRAQIRAREQVLLNGDDTATHMDADTAAAGADVAQKLAKGYRRLALDNSATINFGGPVTTVGLDAMKVTMGKLGVNIRELTYVFGPTGYGQAVSLEEVSSVDQIGALATLVTGSLAAFRGIPIIVSEFVREDLNATGVEDGTTTDKTVVYLVNSARFWLGIRRPIMTKIAVSDPEEDTMKLASYSRWDFKGHAQSATETSAVLGFNVSI